MKISEQSVELIDYMGDDLSVVNAARVSFNKQSKFEYEKDNHDGHGEPKLSERDTKLINYLAKHNHWTPFAHAFASFRIKAPIFVARQLVKHQVGLAWNEVSRRYVDDEPEFYWPKEWRGKPENAKQGSDGILPMMEEPDGFDNAMWFEGIIIDCLNWYNDQIKRGMAPEQARMVLPQNTMTEWIWSGSLAAFARVVKLRTDPHAQRETQEVAKQIGGACAEIWPVSFKALLEN